MQTVLISGGTGMVGTRLTEMLVAKNYKVIILTRKLKKSNNKNISYALWNVDKQTIDANAVSEADYIIHLAGANVADKRWTDKRKQEIVNSRVDSGKLLVNALKENNNKVKAVISASAIGWYGADTEISKQHGFKEDAPADNEFLGETCKHWEQAIEGVEAQGKRLVKLRTGIVLSNKGGAFKEFIKPMKFGVAGILGNGKQTISWIHLDDLCAMYIYAMENEMVRGSYNAVAPQPVSNKELTLIIAEQKQKFYIPVHIPEFALKILLGEMSIEVLKSATVSADKIKTAGYVFQYPAAEQAVQNILSDK